MNSSIPQIDRPRLERLLDRVRAFMADGEEHALHDIADACGGGEASVSARLRELNRCGFLVTKRRAAPGSGLHLYRHPRKWQPVQMEPGDHP